LGHVRVVRVQAGAVAVGARRTVQEAAAVAVRAQAVHVERTKTRTDKVMAVGTPRTRQAAARTRKPTQKPRPWRLFSRGHPLKVAVPARRLWPVLWCTRKSTRESEQAPHTRTEPMGQGGRRLAWLVTTLRFVVGAVGRRRRLLHGLPRPRIDVVLDIRLDEVGNHKALWSIRPPRRARQSSLSCNSTRSGAPRGSQTPRWPC
jgi:hypothetical protein